MITAEDIIREIASANEADTALIVKAFNFAQKAHEGHKRYSGEPYMTHIAAVGLNLAQMGVGPRTIAAGLLHDTIEDTKAGFRQVADLFGTKNAL